MFESANLARFALHIPAVRHDFKVLAFDGFEAISALYAIKVDLVSENPAVDLPGLLARPAFLKFGDNGEGLHGRIEEVFVGESSQRLTRYSLTLVPALHYLQFCQDQRIFQKLTVPKIIAKVLEGHGILADAFTFHVRNSPEREYCTQYGESDFEFVQRLCAEEGIAWHHQHSPQGHRLVFTEDQAFFPKLGQTLYQQDSAMVAREPVVSRFAMGFRTRTSVTTRRDYDFQRPSRLLESRFNARAQPEFEDYRYPIVFESEQRGAQLARQALERHRVDYQVVEGQSDQPILRSGHFFGLIGHPTERYNDLWLLLSVRHKGKQPQVLEEQASSDDKAEDGFNQGYRNNFSVIAWDVFYRPALCPREHLLVSQTARVTGPVAQEIYCDEYGRVKVEFHWDRTERNNEHSSCWLRVSTAWAGEQFGAVTLPRVGMEVVVTFLDGDPDKPLITGCLPNRVTAVPYPLPAHKTRTVLRSQSSPHTGGYNELSIEDRAGQEHIFLRAQRDFDQEILNDSHTHIGNDHREHTGRDSHSLIGNDRFEQVDRNSTCLIKGDELHTTQGEHNTVIGSHELISVSGDSSTTAQGVVVIQAGPQVHFAAPHVVTQGDTSLTLQCGGHHLLINASGIFSSVTIVEGGAPLAGQPAQAALSAAPQAAHASVMPLPMEALLKQNIVFRETDSGVCPVCDAAQEPAQSGGNEA